jgi:hypothetical protein
MGRASHGATASACVRLSPALSDSILSHSQAMILGGVARDFLLFGDSKAGAKRAAMYPKSVLSAFAVSVPARPRATRQQVEW